MFETIREFILAGAATVNIIFSALLFLRSRTKSSLFYVAANLSAALWIIGIYFFLSPGVDATTYLWTQVNDITTGMAAFSFFFFAYYFYSEDRRLHPLALVAAGGSFVAMIIAVIGVGPIPPNVVDIIGSNGSKEEVYSSSYIYHSIFLLSYFGAGIALLVYKWLTYTGLAQKQLRLVVTGTGIAISVGLTTNLLLPTLFNAPSLLWVGPIGTVIMVSMITYAIVKYKLWNFQLIAMETFSAVIILVLVLDIFNARTTPEYISGIAVLIAVVVLSMYLIWAMIREVELRKDMEKTAHELSEANSRLREIDIEKSDFVSITSHQFRTPLTVIKGYASMLLEDLFGEVKKKEHKKAIEKIFQASQRLVILIEDFMNISRIEKREMNYNFESVDLRTLLHDSLEGFRTPTNDEDVSFEVDIDENESYRINADSEKILQVINNVVDNAIKYSPDNGTVWLTLTRNTKEGVFRVAVEDQGIGIEPDMMPKLFEKFSRSQDVSKLHTEGRGLGLYIARQIMKAHNGRIWAESEGRGTGTTFYLEFPDPEYTERTKEVKNFLDEL